MRHQKRAAGESYMKALSRIMMMALCAVLALAAVSCADNSKGGKNDLSGSNVFVSSTTEYRHTETDSKTNITARESYIFTSEKMSKRKWISFILGIVAIFFMIRPWDMQEGNSVLGFSTLILAAVTFGAYTVMGKQTIARIGTFTQTSIGFFCGSAVLLIALLVTGRPVLDGVAEELPVVIYVGVIVTGLGYLIYFLGVLYSDASTGSIAFFVKPAIAPFIAIAALHETIYWNTIVGIGLLLAGSVITIYDTFIHRNDILAGQSAEDPAEEAA